MAANLGDIVSTLTLDRRQFQTGMEAASKELGKVRGEITKMAAESAKGNAQAALSLVRLIEKEEELAATAKRAADIEKRAREGVLLHRREELHVLAMQEQAERKVTAAIRQRAFYVQRSRAGGGGMVGGGLGTGLAFGLSDAATAYQFGGARGASLGIANNLPMIGMGLADIGAKAAAAGGSMARFGGILSKFAGPAGMALSVILPLGAGLASYALDAKKAADATEDLEKSLAARAAGRERMDRIAAMGKGEGIGAQEGRVKDARGRLADIDAEIFTHRSAITRLRGAGGSEADVEQGQRALDAALAKRMGIAAEVAAEESALREGRAAMNLRRPRFDMGAFETPSAEQFIDHQAKQDSLFRRPGRQDAARIAALEGDSVGLALVNGLRRRLATLMGQGPQRGGPSLNLPELATRGNSIDRIIDIAKGKAEAAQEAREKRAEEQRGRMVKLLEDLIDAVEDQRGLKPAGIG
jgi:hypothetical protein